jgi:hypothetical protein
MPTIRMMWQALVFTKNHFPQATLGDHGDGTAVQAARPLKLYFLAAILVRIADAIESFDFARIHVGL